MEDYGFDRSDEPTLVSRLTSKPRSACTFGVWISGDSSFLASVLSEPSESLLLSGTDCGSCSFGFSSGSWIGGGGFFAWAMTVGCQ